jgi:hypothetical protein
MEDTAISREERLRDERIPMAKPVVACNLESTYGADRSQRGIRVNAHLVILSVATVLTLATASECKSIAHLPSLLYGVVLWEWWGCIASLLWTLGKCGSFLSNFSPKTIALHALMAPLLGLIHLLLLGGVGFSAEGWQFRGSVGFMWLHHLEPNRFGLEILIYVCVIGVVGVTQFQLKAQRDALVASELQRQLSAAQLQALQSQMEPHFLFNTLNAVTSLVDLGRNREASQTLAHLDTILRTTLRRRAPEKIPFTEELRVIESYLAIQQVRFSDRLQVQIYASDEALQGMIPCFLLQPIVENAVKHGIAPKARGGLIEAQVKRVLESLWIQVRDTGSGDNLVDSKGHGIGIQNTRDRLTHFYPGEHQFTAGPLPSGGFEVTIQIPYERAAV